MKNTRKTLTLAVICAMLLSLLTIFVSAESETKISLRIEGDTSCLFNETITFIGTEVTVKDVLAAADDKDNTLTVTGLDTGYVYEINGIKGGKYGGWDGWLYTVNGISPVTSVSETKLSDGDSVLLYFGDPYGVGFQLPEIEVKDGKISFYSMDTVYDENYNANIVKNPVVGATVKISDGGNTYTYTTDANGTVEADEKLLKSGTYRYSIEKYAANGLPIVLRSAPDASYTVEQSPATSDISVSLAITSALSLIFIMALAAGKKNA